jgi:hypothetical protein
MDSAKKIERSRDNFIKVSCLNTKELSEGALSFAEEMASMAKSRLEEISECYFELDQLDTKTKVA